MTYVPGDTPVHRCDARVKVGLLFAYSVALLLVRSWWGMGALALLLVAATGIARLPIWPMNRLLVPAYALAAFSLAFNVAAAPDAGGLSAGMFFAVRMVALVAASIVVCLTTTSSELLAAFRRIASPFGRAGMPVDDIAFTLALSVRFIPVIEGELLCIRAAQRARGAESSSSPMRRIAVWGSAFTSLFIGMFRRADALALAMDARCYGAAEARSELPRGTTADGRMR